MDSIPAYQNLTVGAFEIPSGLGVNIYLKMCTHNTMHCVQKITQMLIKFNFRFGWLWLPCISVGLFLVIYDAMSYIGAPFLYIHKIDYFFHIVLFSNFWKISYFPGKNCQFCEYKKSELQYNSWHHERPEKNLLAFVGSITYRIWIKSIFWNCFLHCATVMLSRNSVLWHQHTNVKSTCNVFSKHFVILVYYE